VCSLSLSVSWPATPVFDAWRAKERDKREETLIRTGRLEQKVDLGDPGMGRMGKGSAFQNVSHHFRTGRKRTRKAGEVPGPDRLDKLCGGGRGSPKKACRGCVCVCLCVWLPKGIIFLKCFAPLFFFATTRTGTRGGFKLLNREEWPNPRVWKDVIAQLQRTRTVGDRRERRERKNDKR
jgi:hypothetical protein